MLDVQYGHNLCCMLFFIICYNTIKMKISLEAKRLKDLEPQIRKAVSIAHNRTMKKISSDIGKEWGQTVLDELSFSKAPNIREFVKIRRERKRNLNSSAIITIDSKSTDLTISPKKRSISIRHFQHRQTSQGVVLKIKNQPKLLRSAFITKMPNKKHAGIYQRVNKARLLRIPMRGYESHLDNHYMSAQI